MLGDRKSDVIVSIAFWPSFSSSFFTFFVPIPKERIYVCAIASTKIVSLNRFRLLVS